MAISHLVVVALRLGDQPSQLGPALLVAQREETQEDDRQHVALVVGWLDGAAQLDGRLEEFFQDVGDVAVGSFIACFLLCWHRHSM